MILLPFYRVKLAKHDIAGELSVVCYTVLQRLIWIGKLISLELNDISELPVCSPLLQAVLKTMEKWEDMLLSKLELFAGPPEDYIPGCYKDTLVEGGPGILKYKSMLEPTNTPFL